MGNMPTVTDPAQLSLQTDAAFQRPTRLRLQQSSIYSALEHDYPAAEIRALAEKHREDIGVALDGVRVEFMKLGQLTPREVANFVDAEIASFIRLAGGGWMPEQRKDFTRQAVEEFRDIPFRILAPALQSARRNVRQAGAFVPWVFEAMEKPLTRARLEIQNLERLGALLEIPAGG